MQGFLNVLKPSGVTSSSVVGYLKKNLHIDKIGHMGTLDPMASGVLPIAIGKATKLFDIFLEKRKIYIANFTFGIMTDTIDSTGLILEQNNIIPNEIEIKNNIIKFLGKLNQMPPKYSAKKVNGVCAYKLARKNIEFDLKTKEVEIFNFEFLKKINDTTFSFKIECSSGTYIRSIARDLGEYCNTICIMSDLIRINSGIFNIDDSIDYKLINLSNIIPIENVFPNYDRLDVNDDFFNKIMVGISVPLDKILTNNTFVYFNNELLGLIKKGNNKLKLDVNLKEK